MIKFDLPKNQSSIIKVIGVGGGGSNAVTHMYKQGIRGVDFIITNTDNQALEISPVPTKIQLGTALTEGMGAGSIPEVGREAAKENLEDIRKVFESNTKMVFITAGMGGGTGTGAAPVIAATAREMGILTVGIVTLPFTFEGRKRRQQADAGIQELRKNVDTLLIICNDKLRELHGNLTLTQAFNNADNILTVAAKGIAEIITVTGYINVDFKDVNTVMRDSGVAIMGSGIAEGENRAIKAVELALTSPLLNDNNIKGAKNILLYIASGSNEVTMDEVTEITDYIQSESGSTAEIIWGNGIDETLENKISVTIVATGFNSNEINDLSGEILVNNQKKVYSLVDQEPKKENVNINTEAQKYDDFKIITREIVSEPQASISSEFIEPKKIEYQNETPKPLTSENKVFSDFKVQVLENNNDIPHQNNTNNASSENDDIVEFKIINKSIIEGDNKNETVDNIHEYISYDKNTEKPIEVKTNLSDKSLEENVKLKHHERMAKLREMSMKIRTPQGLNEIESEPAYKRSDILLENHSHSSEASISRYSLVQDANNQTGLKANSFLHDNVD